jgi:hypothetical protein
VILRTESRLPPSHHHSTKCTIILPHERKIISTKSNTSLGARNTTHAVRAVQGFYIHCVHPLCCLYAVQSLTFVLIMVLARSPELRAEHKQPSYATLALHPDHCHVKQPTSQLFLWHGRHSQSQTSLTAAPGGRAQTWSYLACRIGHLVPIWQPLIGSSFHVWPLRGARTYPCAVLIPQRRWVPASARQPGQRPGA